MCTNSFDFESCLAMKSVLLLVTIINKCLAQFTALIISTTTAFAMDSSVNRLATTTTLAQADAVQMATVNRVAPAP